MRKLPVIVPHISSTLEKYRLCSCLYVQPECFNLFFCFKSYSMVAELDVFQSSKLIKQAYDKHHEKTALESPLAAISSILEIIHQTVCVWELPRWGKQQTDLLLPSICLHILSASVATDKVGPPSLTCMLSSAIGMKREGLGSGRVDGEFSAKGAALSLVSLRDYQQ